MKREILAFILLISVSLQAQQIKSPDGKLQLDFSIQENGKPTYSLTFAGKSVISPSHLGFELRKTNKILFGTEINKEETNSTEDFATDFEVINTQTNSHDEVWEPVGEKKKQFAIITTKWQLR